MKFIWSFSFLNQGWKAAGSDCFVVVSHHPSLSFYICIYNFPHPQINFRKGPQTGASLFFLYLKRPK